MLLKSTRNNNLFLILSNVDIIIITVFIFHANDQPKAAHLLFY